MAPDYILRAGTQLKFGTQEKAMGKKKGWKTTSGWIEQPISLKCFEGSINIPKSTVTFSLDGKDTRSFIKKTIITIQAVFKITVEAFKYMKKQFDNYREFDKLFPLVQLGQNKKMSRRLLRVKEDIQYLISNDVDIRNTLTKFIGDWWPEDKLRSGQVVTCQDIPIDIYVIDTSHHEEYLYKSRGNFYGVALDDYDKEKIQHGYSSSDPGFYPKNADFFPTDMPWLKREATNEELLRACARCKNEFYRGYLKKLLKSKL